MEREVELGSWVTRFQVSWTFGYSATVSFVMSVIWMREDSSEMEKEMVWL